MIAACSVQRVGLPCAPGNYERSHACHTRCPHPPSWHGTPEQWSRRRVLARSAKPAAWLTTAPTARPERFSIRTWPRQHNIASKPLLFLNRLASESAAAMNSVKNVSTTSCSSRRSRFCENTGWSQTASSIGQSSEPEKQQVVAHRLHQHALAAH